MKHIDVAVYKLVTAISLQMYLVADWHKISDVVVFELSALLILDSVTEFNWFHLMLTHYMHMHMLTFKRSTL